MSENNNEKLRYTLLRTDICVHLRNLVILIIFGKFKNNTLIQQYFDINYNIVIA